MKLYKFMNSGKALFSLMGVLSILSFFSNVFGQFSPPVGVPGSEALPASDEAFVAWATGCVVQRGLQDISRPDLGLASAGFPQNAVGPADGQSIVSLGDGGTATLVFDQPVFDGPGWDFAIFENSFNHTFLEFAFVEVSNDGQHFVRFPAISLIDTVEQVGSFGQVDTRKIENLAGKFLGTWGTPFDLADLPDSLHANFDTITHIRLVDVIGTIDPDLASRDADGRIINDPWPTPFPSSGFDLDAIGVIHQVHSSAKNKLVTFPNPVRRRATVEVILPSGHYFREIFLWDSLGRHLQSFPINQQNNTRITLETSYLASGIYYVTCYSGSILISGKLIVVP